MTPIQIIVSSTFADGLIKLVGGAMFTLTNSEVTTLILPDQTGNAGKVLSTDGVGNLSWISAGGGGSGTVTSVSVVTANGVSGTVSNPTTTPAITLTLGAITPSSVNASGTVIGSNLSGTNTGDQTITLTSDVTGSGTGSFATTIANNAITTVKINNSAVTLAKIANASANSVILGSGTAGSGSAYAEIALGSGLAMSGTTLSATGSGGTVTSFSASGSHGITTSVTNPTTTPALSLDLSLNGVALDRLATIADQRLLGNVSGSTASVIALTSSQVSTFLGLGTAAFQPTSAFEVPLTFSTGLTRASNTITVNTSQNISTLSNLTTNGFVKTSGGTGALSIDTNTYLTGNQTITLSNDVSGSGATSISVTIAANAVTYAKMQAVSTTSRLLGSSSTTTTVQEITLGSGLSLSGTTLTATGSGGTVTSVTGSSPIASSGGATPAISIADAAANGSTKGAASFTAADFNDDGSGLISLDYTNGQKASGSQPGFLSSADWTTFNNKSTLKMGLVYAASHGALGV